MNRAHENLSEDLLARYFAHSATPEDIQTIESWLSADAGNAAELEKYRLIWNKSHEIAAQKPAFDTDRAWLKVKQQMSNNAERSRKPVQVDFLPNKKPQWISWAAAIAGLAILSSLWFFLKTSTEPEKLTFATTNNTVERLLPDGTKVFLNFNSSISYPETFDGATRNVTLTGEAFFDVKRDAAHPFVIAAGGTEIKVLGTSFNVKAYAEKPVRVDVSTGKVRVSKDHKVMELIKGQGAEVVAGTIRSVNADLNIIGYRTQIYDFESTELEEVITSIRDGYHADIRLQNPATGQCRLTIRFEKETLDAMLGVIAETLGLEVRKDGQTYWLEGRGCQ